MRKLPYEVSTSKVKKDFETCWRRMIQDLREPKSFETTGGQTSFEVWSKEDKLFYKKSIGNVCPLSKSDFRKAYNIFRQTGSLRSSDYRNTFHGSYIPPLLRKYFTDDC